MTEITEKWARTAAAGAELDRVVLMGFLGWDRHVFDDEAKPRESPIVSLAVPGWPSPDAPDSIFCTDDRDRRRCSWRYPHPVSTRWEFAGPLLEAMNSLPRIKRIEARHAMNDVMECRMRIRRPTVIDLIPLDTARACAVLVAWSTQRTRDL